MAAKGTGKRGGFGKAGLPVATGYVVPKGRNRALLVGLAIAAAFSLGLAVRFLGAPGFAATQLPLTASHAALEGGCDSCHVPFVGVEETRCVSCHEPTSDLVAAASSHALAAHVQYGSGDTTRGAGIVDSPGCTTCHVEHGGRTARLTAVPDVACTGCHADATAVAVPVPSLDAHPEFAALGDLDADTLRFAHAPHVARVLEPLATDQVEAACATCHVATPGGRGFAPIAFERSCATCHLGDRERTLALPVRGTGDPLWTVTGAGVALDAGVEAVEAVRARQGSGEGWARTVSPALFRRVGQRVMKTRVDHRDPWILHNLRQMRTAVWPQAELLDLLAALPTQATADSGDEAVRREAVETLRAWSAELRGREAAWLPEELDRIDALLVDLRARLRDEAPRSAGSPRSPALGPPDLGPPDPRWTGAQIAQLGELATDLTATCALCHTVESFSIASVQRDQRALDRAEFDHAPHRLQLGCTDCHDRIAIDELAGVEPSALGDRDHAGIQNLPSIERCQSCHVEALVPPTCSSCHAFHPGSRAGAAADGG